MRDKTTLVEPIQTAGIRAHGVKLGERLVLMSLRGVPPGVLARAVALFASTYALADVSLELASAGGEKKAWHHVLSTAMAGAVHTAAGRLSVPRGIALGAALGFGSIPAWYATVRSSPSLLQLLRRAQASDAAPA